MADGSLDHLDVAPDGPIELRPERDDTNTRLDKYVAAALPDLSRAYVQRLIEAGHVRVDGFVRRTTFKVTPGEIVLVDLPPPVAETLEPEPIPLDVVYEDADLLVIDKPAGLVVHPAPGHARGTLVNALLHYAPDLSVAGTNRPGIVHRLDKDTSGLIVVAKTDRASTSLVAQWASRAVKKNYVALAAGLLEPDEGTIDAPIGRDPLQRQRMAVTPKGRPAITHFSVRERFKTATLLDVEIETGRTHQIRVHLAFIDHPVVGDPVYGRSGAARDAPAVPRQFLHAAHLAFRHPDGRDVAFDAPLPPDLQSVLDDLRSQA